MYDAPYGAQGVHWSDNSENSPPPFPRTEHPHGTHNVPPHASWYPPTCIRVSPMVLSIPHGTRENPPRYAWYPPMVLMISPHGTHDIPPWYWTHIIQGENRKVKSTLYDTILSTRSERPTYMIKVCMQFRYLQIRYLKKTSQITAKFFPFYLDIVFTLFFVSVWRKEWWN